MLRLEMFAYFCEGACCAFPCFKRRSVLVGPVFRLAKLMFDTSPRTLDQKDGLLASLLLKKSYMYTLELL
jgi:hypothetical protein